VEPPLRRSLLLQEQPGRGRAFRRDDGVGDRNGLAGAEVARILLDAHGLARVRIERISGVLSDHYDRTPARSGSRWPWARGPAAIGIAAHEVAYAYQDADGSRVYRARKRVGQPLARLAPIPGS
jgi:Zn-dependent membrane protease YugP